MMVQKILSHLLALVMLWTIMTGAIAQGENPKSNRTHTIQVNPTGQRIPVTYLDEEAGEDDEDTEETTEEDQSGEIREEIEAQDLFLNHEANLVFQAEETAYIRFVPEMTDGYVLFSISRDADTDPVGYLYDSDMNMIIANDDSQGGRDFRIASILDRGKTYYYGCGIADETEGQYSVKLEKVSGLLALTAENTPEMLQRNMKLVVRAMATKGTELSYSWYQAKENQENDESIEEMNYSRIENQGKASLTIPLPEAGTAFCCIASDFQGNEKMVYYYLGEDDITVYESEMKPQEAKNEMEENDAEEIEEGEEF